MKKLIKSLSDHKVPSSVSREHWKASALYHFGPYFRRPTQLRENIDSFMIELRNLARIDPHVEHLALMQWCLALYRRVIRVDRICAYAEMHRLFGNMGASDARWLNLFQTASPLGSGAAPQDIIFQIFGTIDGVTEGCLKPHLQVLYSFAVRDATGSWPTDVRKKDFGALVADFPLRLKSQIPILFSDPDLKVNLNQWRNIAAHKSYRLVRPKTIEVSFGKTNIQTRILGLHRLRDVSRWILKTHHAIRLATNIIFIEHMKEIVAIGKPNLERPLAASVLQIGHNLSTVGYEVIDWKDAKHTGSLTVRDLLGRDPTEALVHASQQLIELGVAVLADVTTRSRILSVCMQLQLPNGDIYGAGTVTVAAADAFSLRKISLQQYMNQIAWRHGP
jgi:hypothetical protein